MYPVLDLKKTGSRIESLRKERGYSVKDIQQYLGFEYPQAVYNWQHGECLPSVDNLYAISKLLKVSIEDILVEAGMSSDIYIRVLKYCFNDASWVSEVYYSCTKNKLIEFE